MVVPLLCVCWEMDSQSSDCDMYAEKDNVTSMPGEMERDGISNIIRTF